MSVGGTVVKPKLLTDQGLSGVLDTTICGDNIYFYDNYTVVFVVTADKNCLVRVKVSEAIQLTTHLSMSADEFYSDDGLVNNFIDRVAALL